eukprot:2911002-Pleurochrysis_carterae.AAC.1
MADGNARNVGPTPVEGQLMEICGCSAQTARAALEAAGPSGVEHALELILSGFEFQETSAPHKMVCLVREDLSMGAGKIAAQVAHGVLGAYRAALQSQPAAVEAWASGGEATIVLKVMLDLGEQLQTYTRSCFIRRIERDLLQSAHVVLNASQVPNLLSLEQAVSQARSRGLTAYTVCDAGRTQVAAGTTTVGCIGPAPVPAIDAVTGTLSLL